MTLASVGSPITPVVTGLTFPLTPSAVHDSGGDHFIVVEVISTTAADYPTALSSSNVAWDATPVVAHTSLTANSVVSTVFKGKVTTAGPAAVTVATNTGSPSIRVAAAEGSSTAGYSSVTLNVSGTVNAATTLCPSLTPGHGAGEFYFYFGFNAGSATAGSTSGYTYGADANGNGLCFSGSCGSGAQQPAFGASDTISGIAVMLYEAVTSVSGAATLAGSGSLGASGSVAVPGATSLAGTGSLGAGPTVSIPDSATLYGLGTLTAGGSAAAPGQASADLFGTGTLGTAGFTGWEPSAVLTGTGTLGAQSTGVALQGAALSGTGVLSVGVAAGLKFTAGLFGAGFLSIPQVSGGLVPGVGGAATSQALPGSSQVAVAPQGSTNWQWLGTLGQVTALTYGYVCPGGCDQLSMTIMAPAAYRTQLFNPGWQVKVTRGGHQVWYGKLDEPQYQPGAGWTLTAVGAGSLAANFVAYYSVDDTWPEDEPDEILNRAISRGLPWYNPGQNSSPYFSQFWFGQATDPGSQMVSAFLALICTRGGLTWYVNSQPGGQYNSNSLSVFPLPTAPSRLLVCATPVARTLGGDLNSIFIRYMSQADNATTGVAASYDVVLAQNAQSVAAHEVTEVYVDLSDAGVLGEDAAQQVGYNVLDLYQRASFAGPFTASYGQLLNTGGQAIDPGTDQAGTVIRLILTDFGYGGEVTPNLPITFIVGAYEWDDFAQIATITPMVTPDMSLTGLLSAWNTVNTPLAVASS